MAEREWGNSRAERGSGPTRGAAVREWGIDGALVRQLAGGPVTRDALIRAGSPADAIDRRVASGLLEVLWPTVYILAGTPATDRLTHQAALLACGPRSVLSSFNAAVEWALIDPARGNGELHITVPAASHRRPRGITVHRATLTRAEVRKQDRLLLTSPIRTLQDLAATHPHLLERAINEAYALKLFRPGDLEPAPGRRGARALRDALDSRAAGFDRSKAERILLRLILKAGLPSPHRNAQLGRWEPDFLAWTPVRC